VGESGEARHVWGARQYLSWALPRARVFDEASTPAFEACEGRKAVLRRTHPLDPAECACPGSPAFRVRACASQPMASSVDRPGDVLNVYCLP
jgi:hypothetical protein